MVARITLWGATSCPFPIAAQAEASAARPPLPPHHQLKDTNPRASPSTPVDDASPSCGHGPDQLQRLGAAAPDAQAGSLEGEAPACSAKRVSGPVSGDEARSRRWSERV